MGLQVQAKARGGSVDIQIIDDENPDIDVASCWVTDSRCIWGVRVHEDYRGRGIGHLLMQEVVRQGGKELGVAPFGPNPLTREQTAAFYEKHGFKRVDDYTWKMVRN